MRFGVKAFVVCACAVISLSATTVRFGWGPEAYASEEPVKQVLRDADYIIGVADVIEVQVWKEPELSKTLTVRVDGRISLPLLGEIDAAGKSTGELAQFLEKRFADFLADPSVSVMLLESKSRRYYIVGQISQPGEFPLDYPITILQAIARSGGFLQWAKTTKISVVRNESGKKKFIKFDYDAFVKGKNIEQDIFIKPGDTIIIP